MGPSSLLRNVVSKKMCSLLTFFDYWVVTFGNDTSASSPPSTTAALDDSLADLHPSSPLPVLIRATDGRSGENRRKRIKISTIVEPGILEKFYTRYAEVCKSGMQGLKKRDKSKRKKTKAKKRKAGGDGEKKT